MTKVDPVISMGIDEEDGISGFFANQPQPAAVPPAAPPVSKPQPLPVPRTASPERGGKGTTLMRISLSAKASIYRARQCYEIATGKKTSMSTFLELCVRRALPRLSKEAADIYRSASGVDLVEDS